MNPEAKERWAWNKIPEDAKDLDAKFDCTDSNSIITPEARKSAEKLKNDSKGYLDENESNIGDLEILKKTFVAQKMLNKLVSCGWQLIPLYKDGYEVKEIKEGAKNVTLLPDIKIKDKNFNKNNKYEVEDYINGKSTQTEFFKRSKPLFDHEPTAEDCRQTNLGECPIEYLIERELIMEPNF